MRKLREGRDNKKYACFFRLPDPKQTRRTVIH